MSIFQSYPQLADHASRHPCHTIIRYALRDYIQYDKTCIHDSSPRTAGSGNKIQTFPNTQNLGLWGCLRFRVRWNLDFSRPPLPSKAGPKQQGLTATFGALRCELRADAIILFQPCPAECRGQLLPQQVQFSASKPQHETKQSEG